MKRLCCVLAVILLSGCCASYRASEAKYEISLSLMSLLGSTQETVLMELGAPQNKEAVGATEVWYYRKSYGTQSYGGVQPYGWGPGRTYGVVGRSWEVYDEFSVFFRNGRMVDYTVHVQR